MLSPRNFRFTVAANRPVLAACIWSFSLKALISAAKHKMVSGLMKLSSTQKPFSAI
jgi:hypothetical protein